MSPFSRLVGATLAAALSRKALLGLGLVLVGLIAATPVHAGPVFPGFNSTVFLGNDDGSYPAHGSNAGTPPGTPVAQPLGFSANFFGTTFTSAFINNNGNLTFNAPLSTFTPFGLTTNIGTPIIAPFFADVDTRVGNTVTFGSGTVNGHTAFGVNWPGVGYYSEHTDRLNDFQVALVDRSDTGAGNFDIYFNYNSIQWETGDASGGSGGLGGSSAHVGYSNGTGAPGSFFEFPGSGVNGAFLDGGPNALASNTNDGVTGQYLFMVRNGQVIPSGTPEPASLCLFGIGLAGLSAYGWRRRK